MPREEMFLMILSGLEQDSAHLKVHLHGRPKTSGFNGQCDGAMHLTPFRCIIEAGNTNWGEWLNTVHLLNNIVCFVKRKYNYNMKSNGSQLVSTRSSTVPILTLLQRLPCAEGTTEKLYYLFSKKGHSYSFNSALFGWVLKFTKKCFCISNWNFNTKTTEAGLSNKSSCLAPTLGVA
jgi:hypothetical protein